MKGVSIPLSPVLAEPWASQDELTTVVNEVIATILIRQRKISCNEVEKILGLSSCEVMNLFLKYRMDRAADFPSPNDSCRWAS